MTGASLLALAKSISSTVLISHDCKPKCGLIDPGWFIYVPTGSSDLILIQEQNKTLTDSPLLLDCKTVEKTIGFSLKILSLSNFNPPPPSRRDKNLLEGNLGPREENEDGASESYPRVQSIMNFIVISTFVLNLIDMA